MHKPTSMMVLGILNISFATLGMLGGLVAMASPFLPIPGTEIYAAAYSNSTYLTIVLGIALVGMLTKLMMLMSGVGLTKGKGWGRSLGNAWAPLSIVYGLCAVAVGVLYTLPTMDAAVNTFVAQHPNQQLDAVQQHQMMHSITLIIAVVMGIGQATVYQVVFLILNNRQAVRDYLAATSADGAAGDGPAKPPSDSPW